MADDYDFPPDLVQLQRDFLTANQEWADAAKGDDEEAINAAYKRAQELAMALHRHPWLVERKHHNDARMALRRAAGG